ncbi:hypothetical protein BH10PSE6_BH10PSE6_27280 [soil metagenome]
MKSVDHGNITKGSKVAADIAAGRDDLMSTDAVKRVLEGESKVRVWRSHRGILARDLA